MTFDATHPFHIHGSAFHVVAMERIASNVTVEQIQVMDESGHIRRNLVDAPVKDTVAVPDGGYTIVRFIASNPGSPFPIGSFWVFCPGESSSKYLHSLFFIISSGYWLFHCHLSFHIEVGMGLIFKIGEDHDLPPIPPNFPKCGSWLPPVEDEEMDLSLPKEKVPVVIQDLPYNVTDSKQKSQGGRTVRPSTSGDDGNDSSSDNSGDSALTTHVPFTLANDEDNFVVPQRLINGTLSHPESPTIHSTSGSGQLGNSFLLAVSLPIGYIYSLYVRR